jgi:hypothetical protein
MTQRPTRQSSPPQDDYRREAAEDYKEKTASKTFKLVEGDNTVRILPRLPAPGSKLRTPWHKFMQHYGVGKDNKFALCGKDIKGNGRCWLCDVKIPELTASNNPADKTRAEKMKAKEQTLLQVLYQDRDTHKLRGPVFWRVPSGGRSSVWVNLLSYFKNPMVELVKLETGCCMTIGRTGMEWNNTRYTPYIVNTPATPLTPAVMTKAKTFEEFVGVYSEEEQKNVYFGRESTPADEPSYEAEASLEEAYEDAPLEPTDDYTEPGEGEVEGEDYEPIEGDGNEPEGEDYAEPSDDAGLEDYNDLEPEGDGDAPEDYEEPAPEPPPRRQAPPQQRRSQAQQRPVQRQAKPTQRKQAPPPARRPRR